MAWAFFPSSRASTNLSTPRGASGETSVSMWQCLKLEMAKMIRPHSAASARHISGLPAVEYHAMRALSASGAWLLAEECPAKFLWRSPWNPLYEPEMTSDFHIGVAAHLAVLEPERQAESIVLIEAADYRTTKA